ncbi:MULTISPECIES: deoxycytidine deaminase [unclassified Clostridium]|uniref:dCTP deaminase domain-containing protein n=1 Tax=unclassified Clostridium TaxID=2614128 RepID=UPI000297DC1F|nr:MULTISPECIES: deoxycytidine deaminase [unclassified Clostridium]EKQ52400.1 MAG: deoxycytidine deaminase [Clostridium sp. Maddingley MBC34-26]
MLSKVDIDKELCRGINIVPFNGDNIKENSINLSASSYAFPMSSGKCFIKNDGDIVNIYEKNEEDDGIEIEIIKGKTAVFEFNGQKIIILLPFSTTLIETKEVLAVDKNIGGTYHSKVGIACQGIGHIGTMLGPGFSGHSLVPIHNISATPLKLNVDHTFVSVVFNYLKSPIDYPNPTDNGHLNKLAEYGVKLDSEVAKFLDQDWKRNIDIVRENMDLDDKFKEYKEILSKRKYKKFLKYINFKNFVLLIISLAVFIAFYWIALCLDSKLSNPIWIDRYWTVGFSGAFIYILGILRSFIKSE